jgi:broad specificity phosphatase PhoE
MSTVIGLLRHGQTDWNVDMRLQGVSDIPLNDYGRQQAHTAANALRSGDWESIVSSPLSRALETANIVAAKLGFENVEVLPELIERSFGVAEGLTYEDWKARYQDGQNVDHAETIAALDVRADLLLALLAQKFEGQRVLTVSHGALIRRLIHLISNGQLPREGERFGNASMTTIEHDGESWKILNYDPNPLT